MPHLYDMPHVYNMPLSYENKNTERKVDKVNNLKNFLNIFLELMKDEITLSMLHGMIDHFVQDR